MTLVDSHCHLDDPQFDVDRGAAIERARAAGVDVILSVGTGSGPPDLEAGIRVAETHQGVYATVGVHPHDARKAAEETWREIERLLAHPRVVALGEIGLDYHYDNSPRECQREAFVAQLALARAAGKPVVIHTREAWPDTWAILEEHWRRSGLGGIMHCFSGGPAEAVRALDMGFLLAFGGVVTYPKAEAVREAARITPSARLLLETDAPYLAPVPHRGRRNEPAYLVETARRLAEVRGETLDAVASVTAANFRRLCLPEDDASG